MAELSTATAFWSYAHADDDGTRGRIRKLSVQVGHTYRMHSGERLNRFFDRDGEDGIKWSQEWRRKISDTIFGTTYFVPIISPCYLRSTACRDEFNQFWDRASRSQLKELLLPILWVPITKPATDDEQRIWDIVQEIQYLDWTKTRLREQTSSKYEQQIDKMGKRLAEISRLMVDRPERVPQSKTEEEEEDGSSGQTPPDLQELSEQLGQLATQFPEILRIQARFNELQAQMNEQAAATKAAFEKIQEVTSSEPPPVGASAGQQIFYLNSIALKLGQPAVDFERAASQLETTARSFDTVIFEFVDWIDSLTVSQRQNLDITSFQPSSSSGLLMTQFQAARQVFSQLAGMSRSLQQPMSAIERGLESLDAVREMTESWGVAFERFTGKGDEGSGSPEQED